MCWRSLSSEVRILQPYGLLSVLSNLFVPSLCRRKTPPNQPFTDSFSTGHSIHKVIVGKPNPVILIAATMKYHGAVPAPTMLKRFHIIRSAWLCLSEIGNKNGSAL
jgi:hypothetical protein